MEMFGLIIIFTFWKWMQRTKTESKYTNVENAHVHKSSQETMDDVTNVWKEASMRVIQEKTPSKIQNLGHFS